MLDINLIRQQPEKVQKAMENRGVKTDISKLLKLDEMWREKTAEVQELQQKKNELAKARDIEGGKQMAQELKVAEEQLKVLEEDRVRMLYELPNIPADNVPVGASDEDNVEIEKIGEVRDFDFKIRDHVEIGELTGTIDIDTARQTSGARFAFLRGKGALLEFALMRFVLDKLLAKGFEFVLPPMMIRSKTTHEAGKFPGTLDHVMEAPEKFNFAEDDLSLIGTAEHALCSMHTKETLEADTLPRRYAGWSSCFRREAGAAGKDTKGIFRVHQFEKLEMFVFVHPDKSQEEYEMILETQKEVWKDLGIPFRVLQACTADIAWSDSVMYDLEAWMPGQGKYREVTSGSLCTDYQARRTKTKYKDGDKKDFVHTINATAISIQRAIVALYENCQQEDGSVKIPGVLIPYTGFDTIEVVSEG